MAPDNREEAILWLNSTGIQELVDDSIMPRESFGPNKNPMTGAEPGHSPKLPVERFKNSLLNTLFVLTRLRSDYAAIKQGLVQAVNYRRTTKGQPCKNFKYLIKLDVNRLINKHNDEVHQKRLRGELPPARSDRPQRMERHLQRMGLGSDDQESMPGIPATEKPMNSEEGTVPSSHDQMEIEKHGVDNVFEEVRRPEDHAGYNNVLEAKMDIAKPETLGVVGLEQSDGAVESSSTVDVNKLPIIYPLRIRKEDDHCLASTHDVSEDVLKLQPRLQKEALFIPIEADNDRVADFYYMHLDNFHVLLEELAGKKDQRTKKHRQCVTNEREQVLATNLPIAHMEHDAQIQYENSLSWKPRVSYEKSKSAPSIYAYLQTMSGLVLSEEMKALFHPFLSEPDIQDANPAGCDGAVD